MFSLEPGDIHWVEFDPILGTEQAGRRPALIVSDERFNAISPRIVVCPITSRLVDWPVVVRLPEGIRTRGVILCDQVRSIDRQHRLFAFIERAPEDTMIAVRRVLGAILKLPPPAGA